MYSTANMNLISWDLLTDDFDHTQLDSNWKKLDLHDHTPGFGVQLSTASIAPSAITTDRLNSGAVTNAKLGDAAVSTTKIQDGSVATAKVADNAISNTKLGAASVTLDKMDPNIIPLGSVMLWYRGPASGATPGGGWEIMDGRAWSGISNSLGLSTGSIPDMRSVFARGSDLAGIGVTGGAATANVAHAHNVSAHAHTVPAHNHHIPTDGAHTHLFGAKGSNINYLEMWARANAFISTTGAGLEFNDTSGNPHKNTYYSLYIKNLFIDPAFGNRSQFDPNVVHTATPDPPQGDWETADGALAVSTSGAHSHTGSTDQPAALTTSNNATTTDTQLSTVSTTPPYVGLVYIMRVR